ncbi:MAG TPA: hypothetical protein VHT34_13740 [Clostridia bacterium]|nr:hypothetical protein [Clostridia bacterium]
MADYEKSINKLKDDLDKAKSLRIRAEARLEQLNKQKQDILAEIESLGVKPEDLENEIELLKKEIEELIEKANRMLPEDLLRSV